jgi:hypothetical protein
LDDLVIRRGGPDDVEPAVAVWLEANTARRDGLPPRPDQESRASAHPRLPLTLPEGLARRPLVE